MTEPQLITLAEQALEKLAERPSEEAVRLAYPNEPDERLADRYEPFRPHYQLIIERPQKISGLSPYLTAQMERFDVYFQLLAQASKIREQIGRELR